MRGWRPAGQLCAQWLCFSVLLVGVVQGDRYPTGPTSCANDPGCEPRIQHFREPLVVCVYVLWGLTLLGCVGVALSQCFSRSSELRVFSSSVTRAVVQKEDEEDPEGSLLRPGPPQMYMIGYRNNLLGAAVLTLVVLTSASWVALYLVLILDYYWDCQMRNTDNFCFQGSHPVFGSYDTNASVAFFWVVTSTLWFFGLVLLGGRFRNLFRRACRLEDASHVWVWTPDQTQVTMHQRSPLVEWFYTCLPCLSFAVQSTGRSDTVEVLLTPKGRRYVMFECTRYLLELSTPDAPEGFRAAVVSIGHTNAQIRSGEAGLDPGEYEERWDLVGPNQIPFQVDTVGEAMRKEFLRYYYVYQYAALGVWLWWSYLLVSSLLITVVLVSGVLNIVVSRDGQRVVHQMTQYRTLLTVKRSAGGWEKDHTYSSNRDAQSLVPGDVVIVQSDWVVPCDLVLLRGSAICDESGLTGESMPIRKSELPSDDNVFDLEGKGSKFSLFAGTKILQAGSGAAEEPPVEAMVINTGIHTSKGQLVSQILFPAEMQFKYDEELPVVFALLFLLGTAATALGTFFRHNNGSNFTFNNSWPTLLCMISQICHPLLPMALTVGQTMSCRRLKQLQIFCLDPKRISISGKIKVFCFDKTGTLTKEGLDFLGAHPVAPGGLGFVPLAQGSYPGLMPELSSELQHALATCHCVSNFGDSFVGNQVEVKMFGATGWSLIEKQGEAPSVRSPDGSTELQIIRRFDFDHAKQTMSVIVKDSSSGELHVFCKGSFEKIKLLCDPSTVPPMYDEVAQAHAMAGCYVLSVASKLLPGGTTEEQVASMGRDDLEAAGSMQLQSLLLFRNELKEDTAQAIQGIKQGAVRTVMITGDNAQCGVYIARACGMTEEATPLVLGSLGQDGALMWQLVGGEQGASFGTKALLEDNMHRTHELIITGDATMHAIEAAGVMPQLLFSLRVFARMSPDGKVQAVKLYQQQGLAVGMCGDGGNDCGALRVAHAGVALSDAEASMVSPFSAKSKSVVSVFDLLREGRASLATSFACFKFLIMYGILFAVLKLCCFYYGVIMAFTCYILIDVIAVVWLSYSITVCEPKKKLHTDLPPSSLLGATNMLSVFGMLAQVVAAMCLCLILVGSSSSYVKFPSEYSDQSKWWTLGDSSETTVIFTVSNSLFVTSAVVFSLGGTFRRSVYHNLLLCISWLLLFGLTSYLLLSDQNSFTQQFHMASEPFNERGTESVVWSAYQQAGGAPDQDPLLGFETRLQIFLIIVSTCVLSFVWEKFLVQGMLRDMLRISKLEKVKEKILA